jgi:Na+-driven multidrug efflux pump
VIPVIVRASLISFSISLVIFVFLNLKPEWFLGFYGQGDDFIAYGIPVMRVVAIGLLAMSFSTVWLNAVTGTGNTKVNLIIELVTLVLYCAYVYVVLEHLRLPVTWGWASEWLYWISIFAMAFAYMRSGKWKDKTI